MATLISSCSDDHAATDVLEVENHVLSRDDQGELTDLSSRIERKNRAPTTSGQEE
ncbi:hypothetical protein OIU79_000706, partial [Salix purpurea]